MDHLHQPNQFYPTNNFGGGTNASQQSMQAHSFVQQQNALNQNRGLLGVSNAGNQQLWQQQMGGTDMGNQGMLMAQMAGMNRNNASMNQVSGQGQSMQQYSNPRQQPQSFPRPFLQQAQQNFGNAANRQVNQHIPQLNNPAMLQALNSSHPLSRQYALLGQAHQQRPQNGPIDPAAFSSQQNPRMNGHMGIDNGLGSADSQSNQQMASTMNISASQFHDPIATFMMDKEGRRLTHEELNYKMALFMRETESEQYKVHNNPAEAQQIATQITRRKIFLEQVKQRIASEFPLNGQPGTPMHMPNLQAQGQQQSPAQRGQTPQQGWNTPTIASAPTQQNGGMFAHGQMAPTNPQMQFNASLASQAQANANAMPRNVPTPVTQQGGPASMLNRPMNSSPRPTPGQPGGPGPVPGVGVMQQIMSGRNIHPIERDKFNESLPQYLLRTGKRLDDQMLTMPSGQKFDLHELHKLVINQGGGPAVKSNDLWPIIAARLGFPTVSGPSNAEPRAQQPYADRAREIYDEYLQDFEKHYTMMVLDKLVRTNTLPTTFNPAPQNQPQGPSQGGLPSGALPTQPQINPKAVIAQLLRGNLSVEMMRSKGVPEPFIQQVEMLRRQAALNNQGMSSNMLQVPRPPGSQATLSHPLGNENFSGSNQMTGAPNGPPLRQVPGMSLPQSQMMSGQQPALMTQGQIQNQILAKTSPERLQAAGLLVKRLREQANEDRAKKPVQIKHIPDSERQQFAQIFEALLKAASEVNNFLPTFHAVAGDESMTKTMVQVYDMAMRQRQALSSPSPEYILDLNMVKRLLQMVMAFRSQLSNVFQQADKSRPVHQNGGGPGGFPPPPSLTPSQQPASQPVPQLVAPTGPMNPTISNSQQNKPTPLMQSTTAASKAKSQAAMSTTSGSQSTQIAPSPAATALTPSQSASAASPSTHPSPQTPKSPKARNTGKKSAPKQTARRSSKANLPSTPTADQAGTPASSAPTPATIASTPDNKENSLKRQREPESSSGQASTDQPISSSDDVPIVKRFKGEWESTPDHSIPKHEEEAASIKTTEQAADFFSQMTEFMQMVSGSEGQGMPSEVSDVLTQVLKSAGSFPDLASSSLGDEPLASGSKSPKLTTQDEFTEYFDYSYFKDEETPDLTANSSTSTGASPESNSAESGGHAPPLDSSKSNDSKHVTLSSDVFDPSHLGFLGEIDGGEAEYFTSREGWRWDETPSSAQDTHWAIST